MHYGGGPIEELSSYLRTGSSLMWAIYTLFQNGRHLSIVLFTCKLAPVASFLNSKFKGLFSLKRGNKGLFSSKQKNTKVAAILELCV